MDVNRFVESELALLLQVSRALYSALEETLAVIDVPRGQVRVLAALLFKEGVSQHELADLIMVRPATMTNMLRRMESAGLITREPDEDDARVSRVFLSNVGRTKLEASQELYQDLEARVLDGFDADQRAELHRGLQRALDNLGGSPFMLISEKEEQEK